MKYNKYVDIFKSPGDWLLFISKVPYDGRSRLRRRNYVGEVSFREQDAMSLRNLHGFAVSVHQMSGLQGQKHAVFGTFGRCVYGQSDGGEAALDSNIVGTTHRFVKLRIYKHSEKRIQTQPYSGTNNSHVFNKRI